MIESRMQTRCERDCSRARVPLRGVDWGALTKRSTRRHNKRSATAIVAALLLACVCMACDGGEASSASASSAVRPTSSRTASIPAAGDQAPQSSSLPWTLPTPAVASLRRGESPPPDQPNYFDSRELGAASYMLYAMCLTSRQELHADESRETANAYCVCMVDAVRVNARMGRKVRSTPQQREKCERFAVDPDWPREIGRRRSFPTFAIIYFYSACLKGVPADAPLTFSIPLCACTTNATIDVGAAPSLGDIRQCESTARYFHKTGLHLTKRQFAALPRAAPPEVSGVSGVPYSVPSGSDPKSSVSGPGGYIPYEGNGRGPTLCADGKWSRSSGRGTCSHHGGVSGR